MASVLSSGNLDENVQIPIESSNESEQKHAPRIARSEICITIVSLIVYIADILTGKHSAQTVTFKYFI